MKERKSESARELSDAEQFKILCNLRPLPKKGGRRSKHDQRLARGEQVAFKTATGAFRTVHTIVRILAGKSR
jgi:hypothetical protein